MLLENKEYLDQITQMINDSEVDWQKLNGKSVMITGAAGMIGSGMVDVLISLIENNGFQIEIFALGRTESKLRARFGSYIDKAYFHILPLDISKEMELNEKVDYIVHAASNADPAMMAKYPVDTLLANVVGMNHVLELAKNCQSKRVLYVSSGEMYGQPDDSLTNGFYEGYCGYVDYANPRSSYPAGKRSAEVLCQSYISQYGLDAVIVRPCHCYGPTMTATDSRAMSQFFRKVLNGEDIVLKSDGTLERSHCYVVDAVQAMYLVLLNSDTGEAYNIAEGRSVASIREIASMIAAQKEKQVLFDLPNEMEKKGFSKVVRAVLDGTKLEKLGWKPMYPIQEGIRLTMKILEEIQ